jgi:hypothetical protein
VLKPAANTQVVPDAIAALAALKLTGGRGIHFNGPASLPVAMALAHADVVAISHDPSFCPGQLLPAAGDR